MHPSLFLALQLFLFFFLFSLESFLLHQLLNPSKQRTFQLYTYSVPFCSIKRQGRISPICESAKWVIRPSPKWLLIICQGLQCYENTEISEWMSLDSVLTELQKGVNNIFRRSPVISLQNDYICIQSWLWFRALLHTNCTLGCLWPTICWDVSSFCEWPINIPVVSPSVCPDSQSRSLVLSCSVLKSWTLPVGMFQYSVLVLVLKLTSSIE